MFGVSTILNIVDNKEMHHKTMFFLVLKLDINANKTMIKDVILKDIETNGVVI